MTPLPPPLGAGGIVGWRLDDRRHAATWASGEGAYRAGGRWNSRGTRAVYCAVDPSTAVLEVAVHKGFRALDTVPHVLTAFSVPDLTRIFVVQPADLPNPNWLVPGVPSAGQQDFGERLLTAHPFVAIPSTVSRQSWNLVFNPAAAAGAYGLVLQEPFALDPRLHPPVP